MKNMVTILLCCVMFYLVQSDIIPGQWIQTNGPYGGAIKLTAASGDKVVAYSDLTGLFLSADKAKNWTALSNEYPSRWITSILIRGDTILLGGTDAGLYISTNNGASWGQNFSGMGIYNKIEALAENGKTIFAGTNKGLFQSTDNGSNWTRIEVDSTGSIAGSIAAKDSMLVLGTETGVFVSLNKGLTWKRSTSGLPENATVKVAISRNKIFAAIDYNGIYISADSGSTWTQANSGLPSQIYFNSLISDGNIVLAATNPNGIFKWTENASAWQAANEGLPDKMAVNSIAVSGGSVYAGTYGAGMFISADEGSSWQKSNNGLSGFLIAALASRGDSIFAGTRYCGVHFADAGLLNWETLNIPESGKYYFNIIAFDSKNIYLGASPYGILRSTDNGQSWEPANNGIDRFMEGITLIHSHKNKMFAATYDSPGSNGVLYYSTDNGNNWQKVTSGTTDFPAPVSMVSNGSDIFAIAHGRIYLSTDDGSSWQLANEGLEGKEVMVIEAKDNAALAGTIRDGTFRSTDKGGSWTAVNSGLGIKQVSSFIFWGSSIVFAGADGGVYISSDDGLSWKSVSSNLPKEMYVRLLRNGDYIFAALSTTLWRASISELAPLLPSAPKLLSAGNNSKDQPLSLRLSWEKALNAEWYHLQLSKDSMFNDIALEDSAVASESKDISELIDGRVYYWRIKAGNGAGVSPWSEVWNFTTVLNSPDSISLTAAAEGIKIMWKDKSVSESGFVIERMRSEGFNVLDTVKANIASYIDSTTKPSVYYRYRVKAFNQYTASAYSDTASIMLTYTEEGRMSPAEYILFQNYPNPFNPVTIISYTLPLESTVRLVIYSSLGKTVKEFRVKNQGAGLHEISFDAGSISSGVYFYVLEARASDGTKGFRQIKKMIILK